MAFSFGSNQTAFGNTSKPTGFGTAFTNPTTTTSSAGFSFGSTAGGFGATAAPAFGAAAQQPTAFGASSFGSTTTAPAFGATSSAPAFGATSSAPAFGATSSAPAFGAAFGATNTSSGGLFGATGAAKPGLFGTTTTSAPSLFSTPTAGTTGLFGSTTTQAPLFGSQSTTTTPSLFGATTTSAAPSLFGSSFGTTGTTGLFGATTSTAPTSNLFGGFGTNTGGTTGFGGFGGGTSGFGGGTSTAPSLFGSSLGGAFGAKPPEQQQSAPSADGHLQQVLASLYAVNIFNDERDDIIKKWNMLQACWGTGKGYYGPNQSVQYTTSNPIYRLKAVGYNIIIEADNSEGLVKLTFNKKESEIRSQKDAIVSGISGILGNKPNLTVNVDNIRAMSDTQTEVRIVVSEKGVTGTTRKIPATDLSAFLNQPTQKQQLTNVGVTYICPYITPTRSDLEEYLSKPPSGIDNQMWEAAKADNPNPKKFMPVAINGFTDLKNRMHNQEYETGLHKSFLQKVDKDIAELRKKHAASIAQITDLKQKFLQLQHRILRVLVKQECTRKVGFTMQPEEELLKGRLETLNAHLNTPTQFKGQLIELMSCINTVGSIGRQYNEHYNIDPQVQENIKQFLQMEQNGISHLISIINNDMQALKTISEGMNQFLKVKNNLIK